MTTFFKKNFNLNVHQTTVKQFSEAKVYIMIISTYIFHFQLAYKTKAYEFTGQSSS